MTAIESVAQPRQRWRIIVRRLPGAPTLAQRDWVAGWEAALLATGLPLAAAERGGPGRPKVQFGPPLPAGMPAENEPIDIFLTESCPIADVRDTLGAWLPEGHELIELHDVWLGEPALVAQVSAVVYRIAIGLAGPLSLAGLQGACRDLLGARSLPRRRVKGGGEVAYDLRPLIDDLEVVPGDPGTALARAHLRVDPERGIGRPEEVVAAIAERIGVSIVAASTVRERVVFGPSIVRGD